MLTASAIGTDIKSITVVAGEWFDKVNGNSYFAGKVLVNGDLAFNMPFQYGYGSHFEYVAMQELVKHGYTKGLNQNSSIRRFCYEYGIAYDATKYDNQKQRDLKRDYPEITA